MEHGRLCDEQEPAVHGIRGKMEKSREREGEGRGGRGREGVGDRAIHTCTERKGQREWMQREYKTRTT